MNITCGNNNLYENVMNTTSQYKTFYFFYFITQILKTFTHNLHIHDQYFNIICYFIQEFLVTCNFLSTF